jgi:hypothetical protein
MPSHVVAQECRSCPPSPTDRRKSPLARCAIPACVACLSIAAIIVAAIRPRSAPTDGPMVSGFPISNRCSPARLLGGSVVTSGRTSIGASRRFLRWAIARCPWPLVSVLPFPSRPSRFGGTMERAPRRLLTALMPANLVSEQCKLAQTGA